MTRAWTRALDQDQGSLRGPSEKVDQAAASSGRRLAEWALRSRVELPSSTPTRLRRSGGAMVIDKTPWLKIKAGLNQARPPPSPFPWLRKSSASGSCGQGKGRRPDARDLVAGDDIFRDEEWSI